MYHTYTSTQKKTFLALASIATLAFAAIMFPLIHPLFWAVVFGVVLRSLYGSILKQLRGRTSLAAFSTIIIALVVVFLPLWYAGSLIARESVALYYHLQGSNGMYGFNITDELGRIVPFIETFGIDPILVKEKATAVAQTASASIANMLYTFGSATVGVIIQFVLMLYFLFFVLRDGRALGTYIKRILPLPDEDEEVLFDRFATMTRAMFKGTLVVALAQGVIGGILFAIAGISSPALWALVMGVLSFIPAAGPALVWVPAGILLIVAGHVWQGAIVLGGGALLVSLVDNLLRPLLVGGDTGLPDALILISVLGGLSVFGIAGLIIGPSIAALFVALWEMYVSSN